MRVRVEIASRQTVRDLETLAERMRASQQIRDALYLAGTIVIRRVKQSNYGFMDRTGRLRRSVQRDVDQNRDSRGRFQTGFNVSVYSDVFYAPFVEFNNEGRYSYLRRALREAGREVELALEQGVDAFVAAENRRS